MYLRILLLFVLLFSTTFVVAQVNTDSIYNAALSITDPVERLRALDNFLKQYPNVSNEEAVRVSTFNAAVATKDSNLALQFALQYLKIASDFPTALNRVAYQLAENKMLLDSALAFINLANLEYEKAQGKKRAPFLDTKAKVYYEKGEFELALETQREVINIFPKDREWDPNYAEYYFNLALYMYKNGLRDESLKLMARTSFFGFEEATKTLNEILQNDDAAKLAVYELAADEFLKAAPDINSARSLVALGWAKQSAGGGLLDKALEFAEISVKAIDENTPFDQQAERFATLGMVQIVKGDYEKGITELNRAKQFATPYSTHLYLFLGKAYEAIGDFNSAFKSYIAGVTGFKPPVLMDELIKLHDKLYPNGPTLDELIKDEIYKIENFEVTHYKKIENNEKIVLAELFTGSECRPCLAADFAYDKLLERYDSETIAVLEYHLHIPAPDPMTNEDTEARAKFYGINSTPTSIIEGVDRSSSGGPKSASKNRFDIYSATIENYLTKIPKAKINLKTNLTKNNLSIECQSILQTADGGNVRLFLAMAEETVHYTGYNTVADHRFVVRKMIPSPDGIIFDKKNKINYKDKFDVRKIENSLKEYLEAIEKRANRKVFKEKKYEIDQRNLFLIAFVQDVVTKEVLQVKTVKLSK